MGRSIIPLRPLIAGIFLPAIISLPILGRTIYVDDDGPADFFTIQAAIDDAVAAKGPGSRVLVLPQAVSCVPRASNRPSQNS